MDQNKTVPLASAYHKGRWVYIPLLEVSNEAINEDGTISHFQFTPVDGQGLPPPRERRSNEKALRAIEQSAKEIIDPAKISREELKDLCRRNDIPLGWVIKVPQKASTTKDKGRETYKRAIRDKPGLSPTEFRFLLLPKLRKIDKTAWLIAQIIWYFNSILKQGDDYVTIEEVLRLKINDVDPDDDLNTCISLSRSSQAGAHLVCFCLPVYIWKELLKVISKDRLFVFSNKDGGPLLAQNINRDLMAAGKLAGIKGRISSLSLRPQGSLKKPKKGYVDCAVEPKHEEISEEEWSVLCAQVPGLLTSRGSRTKYDHRTVFNAILYRFRKKMAFRDMPKEFPSYKSVHSQYRRWRDSGVFEAVLALRQ